MCAYVFVCWVGQGKEEGGVKMDRGKDRYTMKLIVNRIGNIISSVLVHNIYVICSHFCVINY